MKRTITSLAIVLAITFGSMQKIVAQASISAASTTKHTNLSYEQLKAAGMLNGYTNEQLRDMQLNELHRPSGNAVHTLHTPNMVSPFSNPTQPLSTQYNVGPDTTICSGSSVTLNADVSNGGSISTTVIPLTTDDLWSGVINLPFPFTFYGNVYNQCIVGSNNEIGFNIANAGNFNTWQINAPLPSAIPADLQNCIMGPWQDLYPPVGGIIQYSTVGTAPNRIFFVEFITMPMFSCTDSCFTDQIQLYENGNVIETHIESKSLCSTWNGGAAIHGLQNATGTVADIVPGRNFPAQWTAFHDGYRFTPNGTNYTIASIPYNPILTNSNISVTWFENGVSVGTGNTLVVSPTTTTTYVAQFNYSACGSGSLTEDSATVTVSSINASASADTAICLGESVQLSASGGTSYAWSPAAGLSNATIANPIATPLTTTTYSVIVTDATGFCSASESVTITVGEAPIADLSPSGTITICGSNGVTLNANSGDYNYTWYLNGVAIQTGSNSSYLATLPGTYQVSVGDNQSGCSNLSQSATVVIGGGPVVSIATPGGCSGILFNGGSITLTASASNATSYLWTPGGQTTAAITVTQPGNYCVTAFDASGCPSDVPACSNISTASVQCGNNGQKVLLCHVPPGNPNNPQTLCIAPSAVPAHLANHPGDCLGSCDLQRLGNPGVILDFLAEAYPNPFNNSFTVHVISSEQTPVMVYIHDVTGRVVETYNNVNDHTSVGSNLAPGLYSAEVLQGDNHQMINILKADR
jgi:hypothetical protein